MRARGAIAALLCAGLAACASPRLIEPAAPAPAPLPSPETFAAPPGWNEEDHAAALVAFRSGCGVSREPAMPSYGTTSR